MCEPLPDSGTCPPGTHFSSNCDFGDGCEMDPCTPDPPYCYTLPDDCSDVSDCACLPGGCCYPDEPGHFGCMCA